MEVKTKVREKVNERKIGIDVKGISPFLFILPILIGIGIFGYGCFIYVLGLSFFKTNMLKPRVFVGLKNYTFLLFESKYFLTALTHTFYYVLWSVPLNLFIGLALGFAMHSKIKYGSFFRFTYLVPWVSSGVIVALIFKYAFNTHYGIVNWILYNLGFEKIRWFSTMKTAVPVAALMGAWKGMGFAMIIFLGAINAVPKNLIESASLEGANTLQIIRYIMLPLIKPTIFFYLVICFIGAFQVFDAIFIFMQQSLATSAVGLQGSILTSAYFTYVLAFEGQQFGRAAAMALIMFFIMLIAILIQRHFIGRKVTPL